MKTIEPQDGRAIEFTVASGEAGRADKFLAARFPGVGRRRLAALFASRAVRVGTKVVKKGTFLPVGTVVLVGEMPATDAELIPTAAPEVPLDVLYEDSDIVAVNKPAGIPCHPLRAGEEGTLANALVARFPACACSGADPREAGLVHRLDIGTSGVMIAARGREVWERLRTAFGNKRVEKTYLALVRSTAIADGRCDAPLAHRGKRMVVLAGGGDAAAGLPASTSWRVVTRFADHTLLECSARTGRMHQIRAHLAHIGAAIVGDEQYGGPEWPLVGHFLHASVIAFAHPRQQRPMRIEAPLPAERKAYLEAATRRSSPAFQPSG